jgi:hypothetical protein
MRASPGITSSVGYLARPGRHETRPHRTGLPDQTRARGHGHGHARGHGEGAILWRPSWSSG